MTWFFAALVVVVLGGIAVVASGRTGAMPPAYDDSPDVVPTDGPIGPEDLRRVRFPLAVRGYRMAEVDALLDRLATQLEQDGSHELRAGEPAAVLAADEPAEVHRDGETDGPDEVLGSDEPDKVHTDGETDGHTDGDAGAHADGHGATLARKDDD